MAPPTQGIFRTSVFLALTVGVPFCVFKGLFGYLLLLQGHQAAGGLVLFWALTDLCMNLLRAARELRGDGAPAVQFCLLGQLGAALGHRDLLMAVDTFLSFGIICLVLWSGWIALLPGWGVTLWLTATTVNLMSLATMNILLNIGSKTNTASEADEYPPSPKRGGKGSP